MTISHHSDLTPEKRAQLLAQALGLAEVPERFSLPTPKGFFTIEEPRLVILVQSTQGHSGNIHFSMVSESGFAAMEFELNDSKEIENLEVKPNASGRVLSPDSILEALPTMTKVPTEFAGDLSDVVSIIDSIRTHGLEAVSKTLQARLDETGLLSNQGEFMSPELERALAQKINGREFVAAHESYIEIEIDEQHILGIVFFNESDELTRAMCSLYVRSQDPEVEDRQLTPRNLRLEFVNSQDSGEKHTCRILRVHYFDSQGLTIGQKYVLQASTRED